MKMDDMILVSVDDHVCEPPDMWQRHVPAKWKDRAPRMVHKVDGSDVWVFEGQQIPNVGLNAVAGRAPEEYGMEPTALSQLRKGCYDVDARIDDMNVNGVLGSLCFPSVPGFVGELFGKQAKAGNRELAITMLRAYNDWHIDEWCGAHPGRFVPLALPPIWDPEEMAREVHRVAKKGCHAITFADTPGGLGYPSLHSEHWDPFWKACSDEGTVVCIHIGSGTGMNLQDPGAPVEIMIATTPSTLLAGATELVFSPIFPKFPALKVALSEGGTGWIPYFLERIDYVHAHHHKWTLHSFPKGKKPSDVFREHVITCFIDDAVGVRNRDLIGVDNMTWECDYPHSDTTWPNAPEILWRSVGSIPEADIHKITWQNVVKHFQYDPFKHIPKEACTVGALRAKAKHVDVTPKRGGGGKKPSDYERGYCTIGDIMKQMAGAYSTPFDSEGGGVVENAMVHVQKSRGGR
jgi:predicted TIM-barrel fold metal-dependent hydrolase